MLTILAILGVLLAAYRLATDGPEPAPEPVAPPAPAPHKHGKRR